MAKRAKKAPLGSGKRFKKGVKDIESREGLSKGEASAIMAKSGQKRYGKQAMSKMAQRGKKRAAKARGRKRG